MCFFPIALWDRDLRWIGGLFGTVVINPHVTNTTLKQSRGDDPCSKSRRLRARWCFYGAAPYLLLCSSTYRRKPAFVGFTILIAVSAVDLDCCRSPEAKYAAATLRVPIASSSRSRTRMPVGSRESPEV
jgi:hypothetical protein